MYTLIRGCKVAEETLQLIPPTANLVRKSLFDLGSPSYRNLLKTHISLLESSCYFQHSTWYGPGAQQPVGSLTFESRCNLQKYPSSSFYSNCFPKTIYQPSPRVLKSTARHRVDVQHTLNKYVLTVSEWKGNLFEILNFLPHSCFKSLSSDWRKHKSSEPKL